MTDEQWLPIPGFRGYEVSDHGRVRSVDRYATEPVRPGQRRFYKGQVLREKVLSQPGHRLTEHRMVTLSVDSIRHYKLVHHLVMLAFVGPRPPGMQVCHWNGDGTDNRLSNLRYGSASDNAFDMVRQGVHNNARKTHCASGHLFDEANTIITSKGTRQCRTCTKAAQRRYQERKMMRAANVPTPSS